MKISRDQLVEAIVASVEFLDCVTRNAHKIETDPKTAVELWKAQDKVIKTLQRCGFIRFEPHDNVIHFNRSGEAIAFAMPEPPPAA